MIILSILLVGISACVQEDFVANDAAEEQFKEQVKEVYKPSIKDYVDGAKENVEKVLDRVVPDLAQPAEPVEAKKQSETECVEFWNRMSKTGSQVLLFDEGHVRVSFKNEVTFAEAITLLEKYNIEKEKIAGIFIQPNDSEEQKYKNNKNIIGKVKKGKEIEIACKILQESAIENAYPEVTLGLSQ